ncbi:MAG: SGNH/GDSL hydrolase family protein [Acidobacteriota bacterium]
MVIVGLVLAFWLFVLAVCVHAADPLIAMPNFWKRDPATGVISHNGPVSIGNTLPTGTGTSIDPVYGLRSPNISVPGNRVVFLGDSIEIRGGNDINWVQDAWVSHFLIRGGGRVHMLHNAGIGGNRTDQMVTRFATDVAAYRPDKVFIKGGTNDIDVLTTAQTLANLQQLVMLVKSIGATPIICTIPPKSGKATAVNAINLGVKRIARSNRITLVDFHSVLANEATGNLTAAYDSGDGVHPSKTGARAMADAAISATAHLWQPLNFLPTDNTDTNNMLANGLFLTDAGADGVADSWTKGGTSSTVVSSLVTDAAIKGKWQQFVRTDSGSVTMAQSFNAASNKWAVGDRLAFTGRVQTANVDSGSSAYKVWISYAGPNTLIYPISSLWQLDTEGAFYIETVVPEGTTGVTVYAAFQDGTAGTFKMAQWGLYNLTKMGIDAL